MLGSIIGDLVGSRFEWHNIKTKEFAFLDRNCFFTDDTVMSVAVAKALLLCAGNRDGLQQTLIRCMQQFGRKYPHAGYGKRFKQWLSEPDPQPYNSWGNGSAMRVSACAIVASSLEEAIALAQATAAVTHDHPEGIKGAQAVAAAIFMARNGKTMAQIRDHVTANYYPADFTLDEIRAAYTFDVSCQGSVPQALEAFYESSSFEDAVRNAISIGGDSDTIAAIAGSIAASYYGIPTHLRLQALTFLDNTILTVLNEFEHLHPPKVAR